MSDKLRELVKKWRAHSSAECARLDGDGLSEGEQGWHSGRCEQADDCADELEAVLALLPTEPVADVAVDNDGWIAFADRWPPKSPALDDPSVETRDTVLVTNSINARDRMGRMSHVWLGMPQQQDGEIMCFEGGSYRTVHGLTHWKPINYTTPRVAIDAVMSAGKQWEPTPCPTCGSFCGDNGETCAEQNTTPTEPAPDREDAERYRWLKARLMSASFDDDDCVGLTFDLPAGSTVWASTDRTIDAAMNAARQEPA